VTSPPAPSAPFEPLEWVLLAAVLLAPDHHLAFLPLKAS